MKNWKILILIIGVLLLAAAFSTYVARITSCYPPINIISQYSAEQAKGFRQACNLDSSVFTQFSDFLTWFVPGIILFSTYWFITRPRIKNLRVGLLNFFLLVVMFDSLVVMILGMIGYPAPGNPKSAAPWVVEIIAALGFLCYLAALALWHWKRWGMALFQGASITLAVFILMGGNSPLLAAVIVAGVIGLTLILRPIRNKLV